MFKVVSTLFWNINSALTKTAPQDQTALPSSESSGIFLYSFF